MATKVMNDFDGKIPMTVDVIDASSGKMNIIVTADSLADIQPSVNKWYLNWTTPSPDNYIRTVLAGAFVLISR